MAFPTNHKTVFVLDHSPFFSMACDHVEFDLLQKSRAGGAAGASAAVIPLAPVAKTMWTCTTEAVLEYCRIIWDIFPKNAEDKLIRFVVSDASSVSLNSWHATEQDSSALCRGLARVGRPEPEARKKSAAAKGYDIVHGLKLALELLTEVTARQQRVRAGTAEGGPRLVNKGRVVCVTFMQDNTQLHQTIVGFQAQLSALNSRAASSDDCAPINYVELVIVHCFPKFADCHITSSDGALMELSPSIYYQVHTVDAGEGLARKLLYMALCHYDLASTTVTGIPMKEEQNASSSANYDVELFHPKSSHERLAGGAGADAASDLNRSQKDGCEYKTITLKWCTPRGSTADLHHCTSTVRITPTDVNSRPSSCLTNFLLSGRSVMLEMPRRSGTKILSHMLTSHGGAIFIHALSVARSVLEDPPSISEGAGGRVTDYRITDLGALMRLNRVAPYTADGADGVGGNSPGQRAGRRLSRFTQCCPLTISATTIFNMESVEPLQRLLVQEELTDDELAECKKCIYAVQSMEAKGEALPVPTIQAATGSGGGGGGKTKTMKKDEQYKMMFGELEKFIRSHCRTERHTKVLDCLLESKSSSAAAAASAGSGGKSPAIGGGGDKVELDVALREIEKYNSMTEREKSDFNLSTGGCLRGGGVGGTAAESPSSPPGSSGGPAPPPPPHKKSKAAAAGIGGAAGQSLLDIWTARVQKEHSKTHVPFAGMRNSVGEKAKLYLNLERNKEKGLGLGGEVQKQ